MFSQSDLLRDPGKSLLMFDQLFEDEDDGTPKAGSSAFHQSGASALPAGVKEPEGPRAESNLVGLMNQGATCYLNSLLQTLFFTPEFRRGLHAVDPASIGAQCMDEKEEDGEEEGEGEGGEGAADSRGEGASQGGGAAAVAAGKSSGAPRAAEHAPSVATGKQSSRQERAVEPPSPAPASASSPATAKNAAPATPAAAATAAAAANSTKKKARPRTIPLEMQRLFAELQLSGVKATSTKKLTTNGFSWQGAEVGQQEDVQELNRLLFAALEAHLKRSSGESLVSDLFGGRTVQRLIVPSRAYSSEPSYQPFTDLMVPSMGSRDLAQAFRRAFAMERLDEYTLEGVGKVDDAMKGSVPEILPPLLIVSVNRFDYDRRTWNRIKLTEHFEYPLVLDMRPFMDQGPPPGADRDGGGASPRKTGGWAAAAAAAPSTADAAAASAATAATAAGLAPEEAEDEALRARMVWLDQALGKPDAGGAAAAQRALELSRSYGDEEYVYDLYAVVSHAGTAHSGHYRAYLRDLSGQGEWSAPAKGSGGGGGGGKKGGGGGGGGGGGSGSGGAGAGAGGGASAGGAKKSASGGGSGGVTGPSLASLALKTTMDAEDPFDVLDTILSEAKPNPMLGGCRSVTVQELGGLMKHKTGRKWAGSFKKSHGPIEHFAGKLEEMFPDKYLVMDGTIASKLASSWMKEEAEQAVEQAKVATKPCSDGAAVDAGTAAAAAAAGLSDAEMAALLQDERDREVATAVLKDAGAAALPQDLGAGAPASSQTDGASPGGSWATVVNKKKKGGAEAHDPAAAVAAAGPVDPKVAKLVEQCGCTPEQASQALATAGGDIDFATALVASMGDAPSGDTAPATEAPAAAEAAPPPPVAGTILDDAGLNANWGHWFCCDDSTVRCIRLQDLGSQFAGRESGYMLYYRSRKLSATERAARTSPDCGEPAPFWKEKVLRANAGLEAARERYARLSNSMRVTVLLPAHFAVEGCVLRRVDAAADTAAPAAAAASGQSTAEGVSAPSAPVHGVEVEVDMRRTVPEFKGVVLDMLRAKYGHALPLPSMADDLHLHQVRPKGSRSFLWHEEVGGDGFVGPLSDAGSNVGHGMSLLAWNGKKLHDVPLTIGASAAAAAVPVWVRVSNLDRTGEGGGTVPSPLDLYVPNNLSIPELRTAVAQRVSIAEPDLMLHLWKPKEEAVARIDAAAFAWGKKGLAAAAIEDGCELFAEDTAIAATKAAEAESKARVAAAVAAVTGAGAPKAGSKKQPGSPARPNAPKPKGPKPRCLAEKEAQSRRKMLKIFVVDSTAMAASTGGDEVRSVALSITRDTIGTSVKRMAIEALGLEDKLDVAAVRLRLGAQGLLLDSEHERRSLSNAGATNGQQVYLESGAAPKAAEIVLRFAAVTGNDRAEGPAKGGTRGPFQGATFRADITVAELRRQMEATLGVKQGDWRLRATNWAEEATTLLPDEHVTVMDSSISKDELLLLEEGIAPQKGTVALSVHLWSDDVLPTEEEKAAASAAAAYGGSGIISAVTSSLKSMIVGAPAAEKPQVENSAVSSSGIVELGQDDTATEPAVAATPPDALDLATAMQHRHIVTLPYVRIAQKQSVLELKAKIAMLPELAEALAARGSAEAPAAAQLLLRELTADLLPGEVKGPDNTSLKKAHVSGASTKRYVVQLLPPTVLGAVVRGRAAGGVTTQLPARACHRASLLTSALPCC